MKNIFKTLGIITIALIIGISMTACGGDGSGGGNAPATEGKLTITGLSEFNGKYIATLMYGIVAADDINLNKQLIECGKISNGTVTLNAWGFNGELLSDFDLTREISIPCKIFDVKQISFNTYDPSSHKCSGIITVDFSNGVGTGTFVKACCDCVLYDYDDDGCDNSCPCNNNCDPGCVGCE